MGGQTWTEEKTDNKVVISAEDLERLASGHEDVKGFENWSVETDTDTGDFDSEKGAMTDYEVSLFDAAGDHKGTIHAGYYTGQTGHRFNHGPYTFEVKEKTKEEKLNEFLFDLSRSNVDFGSKISAMRTKVSELESI